MGEHEELVFSGYRVFRMKTVLQMSGDGRTTV